MLLAKYFDKFFNFDKIQFTQHFGTQLKTRQFWVAGLVMMLFGITMVAVGTINNFLVMEFGVDKLFISLCASLLAAEMFSGLFSFGPMVES